MCSQGRSFGTLLAAASQYKRPTLHARQTFHESVLNHITVSTEGRNQWVMHKVHLGRRLAQQPQLHGRWTAGRSGHEDGGGGSSSCSSRSMKIIVKASGCQCSNRGSMMCMGWPDPRSACGRPGGSFTTA